MSVGRICTRTVRFARPQESVREAARRMVEAEVGTLVVLDARDTPVGIVTDRDVMRCAARAADLDRTSLCDVMASPPVVIDEGAPVEDGLSCMASYAVRRLLVVDRGGRLVGILSLDDVLELLAEEASSIGRLLQRSRSEALGRDRVGNGGPWSRSTRAATAPELHPERR